jgi:hypothetical protein
LPGRGQDARDRGEAGGKIEVRAIVDRAARDRLKRQRAGGRVGLAGERDELDRVDRGRGRCQIGQFIGVGGARRRGGHIVGGVGHGLVEAGVVVGAGRRGEGSCHIGGGGEHGDLALAQARGAVDHVEIVEQIRGRTVYVAQLDDADLGIGLLLGIDPGEVQHFGPVNIDPHRAGIADHAFDLDIVPCVGVQNRGPRPAQIGLGIAGRGAAGDQIAEAVGAQAELVGAGRIEQPDKRRCRKGRHLDGHAKAEARGRGRQGPVDQGEVGGPGPYRLQTAPAKPPGGNGDRGIGHADLPVGGEPHGGVRAGIEIKAFHQENGHVRVPIRVRPVLAALASGRRGLRG